MIELESVSPHPDPLQPPGSESTLGQHSLADQGYRCEIGQAGVGQGYRCATVSSDDLPQHSRVKVEKND